MGSAGSDGETTSGNKTDGTSENGAVQDGQGGAAGRDGNGDADLSGALPYPPQPMLSWSAVKLIVTGELGTKTQSKDALAAVLVFGGLESIKEVTYGDIEDIFLRAARVLRKRCDAKNAISWARFCPLPLLANRWSTPAMPHIVDGSDFVPPNHRSSKGQVVDKKRLMVCVAVHLSAFNAKIFVDHYSTCHASGKKKRKRLRDSFDGADYADGGPNKTGKETSKAKKPSKEDKCMAAARARLEEMDEKHPAGIVEEKATAA